MKKILSLVLASTLAVGFASISVAQDAPSQDAPKKERPARGEGRKGGDKAAAAAGAKIGEAAPAFTLKTADGKDWSLSDAKGKVVVIQWINPECPVCRDVMENGSVAAGMKAVKEQFPDAVYLAINSSASRPSSFDSTPDYLKNNKVDMPALFDRDGKVGKMYGARTTPHCFVINAEGVLVYKGAINNSQDGDGKTNYVVQAVTQLKKGEKVTPSETRPFGCGVKY
jgi:peroxiredoxin